MGRSAHPSDAGVISQHRYVTIDTRWREPAPMHSGRTYNSRRRCQAIDIELTKPNAE
jgi:hypothetical protein